MRRWAARAGAGQHDDAARGGHAGRRRQDLPHRAERALWAGDRQPVHDLDLALLHDAQEGRRDRPEPAGARRRSAPARSSTIATRRGPATATSTTATRTTCRARSRPPAWPAARWSSSIASSSRTWPTSRPRSRALQAGEIDFYEVPPLDLIDELKKDKNLKVEVLNKTGHVAMMRLNWLHPPFNNPEARQRHALSRQAGGRDAARSSASRSRGRPAAPTSPAARR